MFAVSPFEVPLVTPIVQLKMAGGEVRKCTRGSDDGMTGQRKVSVYLTRN